MAARTILVLAVAAASGWSALGAGPLPDLERGKVIPRVACEADPAESYALYLPSGYDSSRVWPVLVLFDPAARGEVAVEAFREGAERRGFLLAASNTARNGPWEPLIRAARAVHRDVVERFSADPGRLYAGGFSGGSRAASLFGRMVERPVAGWVACGAGPAPDVPPSAFTPGTYLGLVGGADFNFKELRRLDDALDAAGVLHRMFYFEGGHAWPPPELCARALDWLDVAAMKSGGLAKDEPFLAGFYAREVQEADALEGAGRTTEAVAVYESVLSFFGGLGDVSQAAENTARIKASKDYARKRKDDAERMDLEFRTVDEMRAVLGALGESPSLGTEAVVLRNKLRIGRWKSEASSARTPEERALAGRVLDQLVLDAESFGLEAYRLKVLSKAAVFFEIAVEACPPRAARYPGLLYNYACILALTKDGDKALDCLDLAVEAGFSDADALEREKDFEGLRETPRFRAIAAGLRARRKSS